MRIFSSGVGDPMLLDSRDELARLHDELQSFLLSPRGDFAAAARTDGDPAPYKRFLGGIRVRKSEGPIVLREGADEWLELTGSVSNLRRYVSFFYFEPGTETDHHHPEYVSVPGYFDPSSMSLIIEADAFYETMRDAVPGA